MIKAGSVLCLDCGQLLSKAYYYNSATQAWVVLKKKPFGKYEVQEIFPENTKKSTYNLSNFKLNKKHSLSSDSIPLKINVDFYEGNDLKVDQIFTRTCPHCRKEIKLNESADKIEMVISQYGTLPTYVVAVIGTTSVGKTSWIQALSNTENQKCLKDFTYRIKTVAVDKTVIDARSTAFGDIGSTRLLTIVKNKKGKSEQLANVLLLDFAGELFLDGPKDDAKQRELLRATSLLRGSGKYPGVDAVVLMDAPDENENLTNVYNTVNQLGILEKVPVAIVYNKVDMLFDNPPMTYLPDSDIQIPLFNKDTFSSCGGSKIYSKENIVPRVCLETKLLCDYSSLAENIMSDNSNSAGFFIQTAEPINTHVSDPEQNSTSKGQSNFKVSLNVMDPIIWILNELDIFPLVD